MRAYYSSSNDPCTREEMDVLYLEEVKAARILPPLPVVALPSSTGISGAMRSRYAAAFALTDNPRASMAPPFSLPIFP
jgi:hypothetical protein